MLNEDDLSEDQQAAVDRLFNFDQTYLIAPTGAGKTIVLLTAIAELIHSGDLSRVLVIAPLKVVETAWMNEAKKWEHLQGLRIGFAIGAPEERREVLRGFDKIVVINEENAAWLFKEKGFPENFNFNGIAIDEIGKWSDTGGERFKALRYKMKLFQWRVGMTAQPVGEGLIMLFGQVLLLDLGERYGRSRDRFKRKYFYPLDWDQHDWEILPGKENKLIGRLRSLTHVMPDYKHELPPKTVHIRTIEIGGEAARTYNRMRIDSVLTLTGPAHPPIKAKNRGVLSGKLEQIANGFLYYTPQPKTGEKKAAPRQTFKIHTTKATWLSQRILEIVEKRGESVVIVYWFEADAIWLRKMYPEALELGRNTAAVMKKWRSTRGQIMLLHPASAGHGVDGLQDTCSHELWIAPTWSRDKKEQTEDRIWRRGQTEPVTIEVCVARGTIDEVKLAAVEEKGEYDKLLHEHLEV